ncbi:MAG: glycosyltransferase family 39 protein [Anaerolineales bacterium]|nr:glycosyltransferase family 39 protein [Anaerolineales bacterium]MCB8940215.1 glycosyltransferase family 39 protein [Ardenticatenaceae bacterium]
MESLQQSAKTRLNEKLLLVGLLLLAFGLRVWALDEAPPGLRYDELQNYLMAGRVLAGERPLYFAESWGHEPLYHYLQAGSLALLGESDWSLRLPSVVLGMIELAATWLVAQKLLGRRVGLLTTAFLAVSFWAILYSRVGLRVGGVTAFATLMVYFLWRCWERPSAQIWRGLADGALAGLFLAAGVYTYLAGRVLPAIFVGFVLFTAVFHRQQFKTRWPRFVVLAGVAALLIWPLWQAIAAVPVGDQRLELLNQAIVALRQGNPLPVLALTVRALGMYVFQGEQDWLYNDYGRPIFSILTVFFFLGGLLWVARRWRQPKFALLLLWFFGGTGPSMIAPPAASVTHSIVAQPVAYIFLGLGVAQAWRWLHVRQPIAATALVALLFIVPGVADSLAFFQSWNYQPEVGELYQAGITAVADAVEKDMPEGAVLVGGPYVSYWQPWNAVNFDLASVQDVSQVRWFNPVGAWVWPTTSPLAAYYFPDAPLAPQQYDPELLALFQDDAVSLSASRGGYVKYVLEDAPRFEARLAEVAGETTVSWPPDFAQLPAPQLPINFDNRLHLLAASRPQVVGDAVRFVTYWRVDVADPTPLVAFVHLTSDGVDIWGQQDWLDVRLAGLQPGDRFAQVHTVPIDPNTPNGRYHVQLGLYRPDTLVRLPIIAADGQTADRIFAGELTLER